MGKHSKCDSSSSSSSSECERNSNCEIDGKCAKGKNLSSECSSSSSSCSESSSDCCLYPGNLNKKQRKAWKKYLGQCKDNIDPARRCFFHYDCVKKPSEIYQDTRRGIVGITSLYSLGTTTITQSGDPAAIDPVGAVVRTDFQRKGTGFFVKGGWIVTAAHLVLVPTQGVAGTYTNGVLPPTGTVVGAVSGRYIDATPRGIYIGVGLTRVNRILVEFMFKDQVQVAEATLYGVDAAGDIAVLCINKKDQWNVGVKNINKIKKCQEYLKWGCSRQYTIGNPLYVIGNSNGVDGWSMSEGNVKDNRYTDNTQLQVPELMTINKDLGVGYDGAPMLDVNGHVVGMVTSNPAYEDYSAGPSEFFMQKVLCKLISCKGSDEYISLITDDLLDTSFYRYNKSFLGVIGHVTTAQDLSTSIAVATNVPFGTTDCLRINDYTNSSMPCKQVVGLVIDFLMGYTAGDCSDLPATLGTTVSPLIAAGLLPGDIIVAINGIELGNYNCQVNPALILWWIKVGGLASITYLKKSESYAKPYVAEINTIAYPINQTGFAPGTFDYPFSLSSYTTPLANPEDQLPVLAGYGMI